MTKYILVNWPEIQDYMEHSRYKECYSANSIDENKMTGVWFVPEDLYEEIQIGKLYPAEFDIPLGHIRITMDEVILNGVKYTRDESELKRGSEVILYNPNKGYWTTTCTSCSWGFPPLFEDNSTLIESEILGIKNENN